MNEQLVGFMDEYEQREDIVIAVQLSGSRDQG